MFGRKASRNTKLIDISKMPDILRNSNTESKSALHFPAFPGKHSLFHLFREKLRTLDLVRGFINEGAYRRAYNTTRSKS